jgi:hypothetical protein
VAGYTTGLIVDAEDPLTYAQVFQSIGNIGMLAYAWWQACFAAGTKLLTKRGWVPIEQLQVGDEVWSKPEDEPGHPGGWKRVEELFQRTGRIWHLHVGGELIRTTGEHPFYVVGKGWTEACFLQPGDLLCSHDGQTVAVEECYDTGEYEQVFNLRVADFHTYFVGDSSRGFSVWAHNADCANPRAIRDAVDSAITDPKKAKNVATVAQRMIGQGRSDADVIAYLKSKGVDQQVAVDGVARSKIAPTRQSMVPDGVQPRDYYMGRTPRINEGPGKQVLARMMKEGTAGYDQVTGEIIFKSVDPKTGQAGWYKLSDGQMSHKSDAVHWWNETGRFYPRPGGQVAPEVRAWMTDPKNYVIEYYQHNLAKGAMTRNAGHVYLNPSAMSLPVVD